MQLHFWGANRQVTGSCHMVDTGDLKILMDCGMYQERDFQDRNWEPLPVPAAEINVVVLSHAHIDHSGLLPRLVHDGFRGPILCTPATADLVDLMLRDSAEIIAEDVAFKRKRHQKEGRRGRFVETPLFTIKDVDRTMPRVEGVPYGQSVPLADDATLTLHDAGHILGSAIVDLEFGRGDQRRRLVYSGDLGQWNKPILRDPTLLDDADYVIVESTYGDRTHNGHAQIEQRLAEVAQQAIGRGGKLIVPTFAVERAQEILYYMSRLVEQGRMPKVPVYLDSPMAVDATGIFEHHRECYDEETWQLINSGRNPLRFPGLKLVRSAVESKKINDLRGPAIIMAPSGMCNAGRIKHHLAHTISRSDCTVLFTGYQGRGTLGRQILEGNSEVRIHGRQWLVRAKIEEIQGFSGHADQPALWRWLSALRRPPRRVFVTHGEEQSSLAFGEKIKTELGWQADVPQYRDTAELD